MLLLWSAAAQKGSEQTAGRLLLLRSTTAQKSTEQTAGRLLLLWSAAQKGSKHAVVLLLGFGTSEQSHDIRQIETIRQIDPGRMNSISGA